MLKYALTIMTLAFAACGISTPDPVDSGSPDSPEVMTIDITQNDTIVVYNTDSVITKVITISDSIVTRTVDTVVTVFRIDTVGITQFDTLVKVDTVVVTVYDRIVDTAYIEHTDTINTYSVDTVRVSDTITVIQIDTLFTGIHDTTIVEITDTIVNTQLSKPGLRDTSITLSMEVDGATISRTFYGKVANGIFYDTTLYQYGAISGKDDMRMYPTNSTVATHAGYYALGANARQSGGSAMSASDTSAISKCGLDKQITQFFVDSRLVHRFSGWRLVNERDIYLNKDNLDQLIPADSSIFLSVSYASHNNQMFCYGYGCTNNSTYTDTYVANVATQYGITTKEKPTRYMCAYELAE